MGDWLSNAASRLKLKTATLNVMTASFEPPELNLHPLTINARDLKRIIDNELLGNGFELDFIIEAKIQFQFLEPTLTKR